MPIGKDVQFGLDDFQKPLLKPTNDALAQSLMNVLLMRPGQLPSMPHIGVDIYKYLYGFEDEIDVEEILGKVRAQCGELVPYIDLQNIQMAVIPYQGQDMLMMIVPIFGEANIVYGFTKRNDTLLFDYKFDKALLR